MYNMWQAVDCVSLILKTIFCASMLNDAQTADSTSEKAQLPTLPCIGEKIYFFLIVFSPWLGVVWGGGVGWWWGVSGGGCIQF